MLEMYLYLEHLYKWDFWKPSKSQQCSGPIAVHKTLYRSLLWCFDLDFWLSPSYSPIEFDEVFPIRMCLSFKHFDILAIRPHLMPRQSDSPFNLSNLGFLSLFFGNIPLTALFSISPPPHFLIIPSIFNDFNAPGLVVCL